MLDRQKGLINTLVLVSAVGMITFSILANIFDFQDKLFSPLFPKPISQASWTPGLVTSWQIQFTVPIDQSVNVEVFDIDLFDNDTSVVSSLHSKGKKAICYFSAGTWEDWRSDAASFPETVKGQNLADWPGEKWLDIRNLTVLSPLMQARMDLCRQKGFDGIDVDNLDGYLQNSGFPITYQQQIQYNSFLANAAHARGLPIGLKNDIDQIPDLVSLYDWQLNEQCFEYNECDKLLPFIQAGKPVFNIEYNLTTSQFCPQANAMNFNSIRKNLSLDAFLEACRTTINIIPGDINGSGRVDIFDYNLLVGDFGKSDNLSLRSDLNHNGRVDIFDYNILVTNFGRT